MYKRANLILFIVFCLIILTVVTVQSSFQHWSGKWDTDFWYIYNASLMASGIGQEWFDHPATTTQTLYSIFYKIYSLFDYTFIYKINEIMDSTDPNLVLQKLYFVTRIFDSINIMLIILFTFKISKILSSKNVCAYFLTLTLILSITFFGHISTLRAEDWAVLFFLISFYYFLRFFIESKITFLTLSGMFFSFSFFSKISILFLFLFTIILIPLFYEIYSTKNNSSIQKFFEKKFSILFSGYLVTLLLYSVIQIFVFSKLAPFEKNAGLDAIIILIINFSYMTFFLIISRFNIIKFKTYFSIFLIFFIGFFISLIIFFTLDILNIVKLNPWLIFHLTNPFNEMIRFTTTGDISSVSSINAFNSIAHVLSKLFSKFIFDKFLFIGLGLIFIISIFKDLKNKNTYFYLLKVIIFFGLLFNILIFNLRFFIEYSIFAHTFYIILLSICFKNVSSKLVKYFCFISLIYTIIYFPTKNFDLLKGQLKTRASLLRSLCNDSDMQFKTYSKQFNESTYKKLCN